LHSKNEGEVTEKYRLQSEENPRKTDDKKGLFLFEISSHFLSTRNQNAPYSNKKSKKISIILIESSKIFTLILFFI